MKSKRTKIPTKVFSHLGLIPVTQAHTKALGSDLGCFQMDMRKVTIDPDIPPMSALQTYWHECVHVALWDAGVKLKKDVEENLCDVLGTYLAAAVRAGFLKVQP